VVEEVLRESEERYRTLLENLPQKISYKDKRSVYVSCNQNYAHDLKIKPEEIAGKTDYDFYPKELADKYRADDRRLMESGETEEIEERYIQHGKELFVHTVKTPVRDEGGNVVGILGVFWDITERREAEQALRESEQRFRTIFDQATDGILLADPENKRFYTGNRMICEMLGYGLEELRNLGLMDIHPEQDLPHVLEQFEKQTRGEIKLARDIPVKRKDGTVFYADINSARVMLEGKTYLMGLFRDVTEGKQAEKALQESEEKYRDLFENASDLIQSVNPQGRFLYVNRAWRKTLGYDEEEVAGLNLFDIIHPHSQAHCVEVFQRVLSGETVDRIEAIFVAKDGRQIVVEGGANCKFLAGAPISTRGIFRDVTERKRVEKEREKLIHNVTERVKELNCLYGISDLVQAPDLSLEQILQGTVDLIPPSWQYPKITCARVVLEGQEFRTENFRETLWKQTKDIIAGGKRVGSLEVCHLEERPESDEGPFLKEERDLINAIAEQLGRIVERKRIERALRESEAKYRDLFEDASDLIQSVAPDGRFIYVNRAWRQTLGYDEQEIAGLNIFDIIHPDSQAHCMEVFQRVISGEVVDKIETVFVTKGGKKIVVEGTADCVFREGKPHSTRSIFRNVTERKKAEAALRESEERYRTLVETAQEGINIVSPQEEIIFSNKAFASMLGYEPWELEGKNLQELVTEEQYKTFQVESQKRVKGIVSRYEIEMRHRDGSYRSALLSAAPLYDSQGNHQGSLGMLVDITERKGAEEALRESEQRFRSIFDTATDGILLASLENKKFHTGNRRICEMLGYSLEEIQRLGVMDVHPEEDLPYVVEQFQRQARGEITLGRDIPVKRKDGSIFYAEVSASPITLEGKTYLMGLFRDVTERRQAEKALRQAEAERRRMTEALREAEKLALVGEMAGRVAHEVLNPVTALLSRTQSELDYANSSQATVAAVKGIIADWQENTKNGTLSHYLLQKSPGKSDTTYGEEDLAILFQAIEKNADNLKRNQEFLSFFERHIMRVVKIIDNLRQMARARREIEEVDVNSCLKEVAELFQDGLDKRKITLLRRLVPGLPKVYVDRTELFQVFSNLLRNAMRAIDNRGEGKGEVTFTSEVTGEEIWVRVIDNGVAIPVAERHLAFEPDFSAKVGEEGRELELPLSRRLVREMGGELLLESSPSESGSTFLVKLPLTKGAEVAETDTEKAVQV
jgi:PAS domain S-box-containing protein